MLHFTMPDPLILFGKRPNQACYLKKIYSQTLHVFFAYIATLILPPLYSMPLHLKMKASISLDTVSNVIILIPNLLCFLIDKGLTFCVFLSIKA